MSRALGFLKVIAMVPKGWAHASFQDIVGINPRDDLSLFDEETLFSFVGMASVEALSGKMDATISRPLSVVRKGFTQFKDGDLLLAKITPCMENGKFCIARDLINGRGFGSTEFHVLRPERGVISQYLFYWSIQQSFRDEAAHNMKGTAGQKRVPVDWIADSRLPLPPAREQARIVAAIDELFARLDAAENGAKRSIILGESFTRSRRNMMVFGGIPYMGPLSDLEKIPEIPLPAGWRWETLGSCLEGIETGKNLRCTERPPEQTEVGIVKVSAVTWGTFQEDESKTVLPGTTLPEKARIRTGDFLFSRANTVSLVGACAIVGEFSRNLFLSDKILRFVFKRNIAPWIVSCLRSDVGRRQIELLSSGNQESMRNVSQDSIRNIWVPLPPLAEQTKCNSEASELEAPDSYLNDEVERLLTVSTTLRQSILAAAFRGELVPQDPADEPASILLERIRAARETADAPLRAFKSRAKSTLPSKPKGKRT